MNPMKTANKKEYILDGLCCANCAANIAKDINSLPGITTADVNFITKTLSMEIGDPALEEPLITKAGAIIKNHDSDITMKEKTNPSSGKKELFLLGLGCADCAAKIERSIQGIDGVKSANLDFVTQRLTIEAKDKQNLPALLRNAAEIARQIEPNITVSYSEKETETKQRLIPLTLYCGAAIFCIALIGAFPSLVELGLFLAAYLLVGGEVLLRAAGNIRKGLIFDENFLMGIATIGAFAIGQYPEGVAVMLFYQIGEIFQKSAVNHSRRSIAKLMDIRPDFANLKVGATTKKVSPEEIAVGDLIIVKPGEKIPLDGMVREGRSTLDTSALTGESLPREVEPGHEVFSGSINKGGLLTIEVKKEFGESTIAKILDLVQNAGSKKAPTENFITKFARYYTPAVVFSALALAVLPPLFIADATFAEWFHRALVFLVVSCPCALVISIPLSYFGGIGGASKNGILIKGGNYLEALNQLDTVVFDKTGTLTEGTFHVTKIAAIGIEEEELLAYAAYAESYSTHPIALSIQTAYGKEIDADRIDAYEEIPGEGIRVRIDGKTVLAGNDKLLTKAGIPYTKADASGTIVYIAVDGSCTGYIIISDQLKADSKKAVHDLRALGIRQIAMLSGDSKETAEKIAAEIGIDTVFAELLPGDKVEQMEKLMQSKRPKGKLAFVGDGINDAPVLARADIGIAMGAMGADAAIEAADVVLMTDEPSKLITAIQIAKKTKRIVWQNILFALGVKGVLLVLGAFGIATMWEAVFGDVGVAIIAIFNAMRALRLERS